MEADFLIVEDNRGDARLILETFADVRSGTRLHFVRSGQDALDALRREDGGRVEPHLIVLDLKMPGMDGYTFLQEAMADPAIRTIPVVVLTGSDADYDKERAFALGADQYFIKPRDMLGWRAIVTKLIVTLNAQVRS